MGVVATTRVRVIVLVVGLIDGVSETGSVEDGGDIYCFRWLYYWIPAVFWVGFMVIVQGLRYVKSLEKNEVDKNASARGAGKNLWALISPIL